MAKEDRQTTIERRQSILAAAAHLFSTQGYTATTIRQISEQINMKSGSLYYYFKSKEEILRDVVIYAVEITSREVRAAVAALPENAGQRKKIEAAMRAHLIALHSYGGYTSTNVGYRSESPEAVHSAVRSNRQAYSDFWHEMLSLAQAEGAILEKLNISLLRPLILGTMNRTVDWYDVKRGSIDELFETVKTMVGGIWVSDE